MARGSFRNKVSANSQQQRNKTANYGHLSLPKGISVFKEEPDSRVNIDILPYVVTDDKHPDLDSELDIAVKGSMWYRRPYKLHRNIGVENTSIVCPTSVGQKCPVCEHRAKMLADGANWQDEDVKQLRASNRNLYYVNPKNEKKLDDKPHLWDVSQFVFQDKLNNELEENDDYSLFPDIDEGLTLRIRFSEESIGRTKFAETSRIDFLTRDYKYKESEINDLPSLDDLLIVKSYRDIEHLFFEAGEESDDRDDDPPERTVRAGSASMRRDRGDEGDESRTRKTAEPPDEDKKKSSSGGFTRRKPSEDESRDETRSTREEKEPDEREARRAARVAREKKEEEENECPSGYAFGKDCDKHPECEDCKVWNSCMDALEKMQAAA